MFIVVLTYLRPLDEVDALMGVHVTWLKRHYKSGMFIASGRQVPREGGIILARATDRAALEAVIAEDPFVTHGVASTHIIEFSPSMTAPGAEFLKKP